MGFFRELEDRFIWSCVETVVETSPLVVWPVDFVGDAIKAPIR